MNLNLCILFIIILLFGCFSFIISKKTFFCFASCAPMILGGLLIVLSPFQYFNVSFLCILQITILLSVLLFFDYISVKYIKFDLIKFNLYLKNKALLYNYLTTFFLSVGLLGFVLKALKYNVSLNPYELFVTVLSQPQFYSESFAEGFSIIHYLGYLGILYFSLFGFTTKSLHTKINTILLITYFASLLLLMIKVQFVIGLYILLWGSLLKSFSTKKVLVTYGIMILIFGLSITIIDNYLFSHNIVTAFEFLIRYLVGGLIGLSQFLDSSRQLLLFDFDFSFFHKYNPLFSLFGIEKIEHPPKVFYAVGNDLGTTNIGTSIQSLSQYFGLIGWIVSFFVFVSISFFTLLFSQIKTSLFFSFIPFFILGQVSISITHMGSIFWKIEFLVIIGVHLFISMIYKLYRYNP